MKIVLLIGLIVFGPLGSFAQIKSPTKGSGHSPCSEDLVKLCKDVKPGGGRMAECVQANKYKLSPACKAHMEAIKDPVPTPRPDQWTPKAKVKTKSISPGPNPLNKDKK